MKNPPGIISSLDDILLSHLYENPRTLIATVFILVSCVNVVIVIHIDSVFLHFISLNIIS